MSPWVRDTLERAVWTFVQAAAGILTAAELGWLELGQIELWQAAVAAGTSAVLSLVKAVAAGKIGVNGTAQLGAATYTNTESPGAIVVAPPVDPV